jgi:magnesium transporter
LKNIPNKHPNAPYVDDDTESVGLIVRLRGPALLLGLGLGIAISFVASNFEKVLSHDVRIAFFLPFIVYLADAIGTQTQTIYARDLQTGTTKFHNYLIKETLIGLIFGLLFSVISAALIMFWFHDSLLTLSIALSIFTTILFAPLVALLTTEVSYRLNCDPAAEAGPIATVIQDMLSVVIFGLISSAIILA